MASGTDTQIHASTHTDNPHRINLKKPGALRPVASARTPGLKTLHYSNLELYSHWQI